MITVRNVDLYPKSVIAVFCHSWSYYSLYLILQDLVKVPLCHMVDMLLVEQLAWVVVIKADTPAKEIHQDSHRSSREEGVEGGGALSLQPLLDIPTLQFRETVDEGLVLRLEGVESTQGGEGEDSEEEEGALMLFLVAILTTIQSTRTLELNLSTHISTIQIRWDEVVGSLLDMVAGHLALDITQEQGGIISQTGHGHLPQVPLTCQESLLEHRMPIHHTFPSSCLQGKAQPLYLGLHPSLHLWFLLLCLLLVLHPSLPLSILFPTHLCRGFHRIHRVRALPLLPGPLPLNHCHHSSNTMALALMGSSLVATPTTSLLLTSRDSLCSMATNSNSCMEEVVVAKITPLLELVLDKHRALELRDKRLMSLKPW